MITMLSALLFGLTVFSLAVVGGRKLMQTNFVAYKIPFLQSEEARRMHQNGPEPWNLIPETSSSSPEPFSWQFIPA